MPRLQRKGFRPPDETRRFPHGVCEVVTLDEIHVSRFTFLPGWRWETDVAPIAGTESCQHRHVGYTLSGKLSVRMNDGTALTIGPGDAYEIPPGHHAWVEGDVPWESVEFTSGHAFGKTPDELEARVLATIVFSDICESTRILNKIGDARWSELLQQHNARVRSVIDRFHGREINTLGDGFLALFDGAAKAVLAAAALTPALADLGIEVRAGVHTGELVILGNDARGVAVHTAARIAAIAGPGEVLVSGTTSDLLDGGALALDFRGDYELKGLSGTRRIFAFTR